MSPASHAAQPGAVSPARGDERGAAGPAFDVPSFPFDAGPYQRFPAPLGATGTDLRACRRRAIMVVLVAWVPLVVLAAVQGLAVRANPREAMLFDIAAHCRYLIALPLLILAEHAALPALGMAARHFATSGLVRDSDWARYQSVIASTRALLTSPIAAVVITMLAYVSTIPLTAVAYPESISTWAAPITDGVRSVSLAGWWRILVSQPLYIAVIGLWLWRIAVWGRFLYRTTRLDLGLVASHPDQLGGLHFVVSAVRAFPLVGFAMATAMAGNIAGKVLLEGRAVAEFAYLVSFAVAFVLILFVGPMFTLRGPLKRLRARGILEYGEVASELGHRFEARWLRPGPSVTDDALEASDFSAVTDAYSIVANVEAIKFIPIDIKATATLVIATLLPFVPLLLLAMPLTEVLKLAANFLL